MKIDTEIVRRILELVEEGSPLSEQMLDVAIFHEDSLPDVRAHARLCEEMGLVTTDQMDQVNGLSLEGHNVLAELSE